MFMHGGYMHIFFNMFALYSFGSALEFLGSKSFILLSCGLGAALMHTGINYYYFNDAINTLAANGFLGAFFGGGVTVSQYQISLVPIWEP
jgi:membrane associated rhomboid family serine protease